MFPNKMGNMWNYLTKLLNVAGLWGEYHQHKSVNLRGVLMHIRRWILNLDQYCIFGCKKTMFSPNVVIYFRFDKFNDVSTFNWKTHTPLFSSFPTLSILFPWVLRASFPYLLGKFGFPTRFSIFFTFSTIYFCSIGFHMFFQVFSSCFPDFVHFPPGFPAFSLEFTHRTKVGTRGVRHFSGRCANSSSSRCNEISRICGFKKRFWFVGLELKQ